MHNSYYINTQIHKQTLQAQKKSHSMPPSSIQSSMLTSFTLQSVNVNIAIIYCMLFILSFNISISIIMSNTNFLL